MSVALVAALPLLLAVAAVSLSRPRAAAERADGVAVLSYPRAWRVCATAQLAVPVVLTLVVWLRRGALAPRATAVELALAAFLFLVLWLLRIEIAGVRHELRPEGLVGGSPWRRRPVTIGWKEIARVRWSAAGQWLVVEAEGGRQVRISPLLSGTGELAQRLTSRDGPGPEALGPGVPDRLARWVIALDAS